MTVIFGDRFVEIFNNVDDENLKVQCMPGVSMKSVSNINKSSYKIIKSMVDNSNNNVVFSFGQMDLHYVIYYDLFRKNTNMRRYIEAITQSYCDFIKKLKIDNKKKTILGVMPNYLDNKELLQSFITNKTFTEDEVKQLKEDDEIFSIEFRERCRKYMNSLIKKNCVMNKMNYVDFDEFLVKDNKLDMSKKDKNILDLILSKMKFIKKAFKNDLKDIEKIDKETKEKKKNVGGEKKDVLFELVYDWMF